MRILHTSDWHVGRSFHGFDTVPQLRTVLGALAQQVRQYAIDVVVVAGDVFDSAMPAARNFEALSECLAEIRDAGARVVLTAGNHDSTARLGFQSQFAALAGIHVVTKFTPERPIALSDEHGTLDVYGIPYLEPLSLRLAHPEAEITGQAAALAWAMAAVDRSIAARGNRSVVVAHCFAAAVAAEAPADDAPRDITVGGLDVVPSSLFSLPTYTALGHIHSRAVLDHSIRYSGAPLHYSFKERNPLRGSWLVDIGPDGLAAVEWLDLPVPRALYDIEGTLAELLLDTTLAGEDCWVRAVLTDERRPKDALRALQTRWPYTAEVRWQPPASASDDRSYAERIGERNDIEVVDAFLQHVRSASATEAERELLIDAFARLDAQEAAR